MLQQEAEFYIPFRESPALFDIVFFHDHKVKPIEREDYTIARNLLKEGIFKLFFASYRICQPKTTKTAQQYHPFHTLHNLNQSKTGNYIYLPGLARLGHIGQVWVDFFGSWLRFGHIFRPHIYQLQRGPNRNIPLVFPTGLNV